MCKTFHVNRVHSKSNKGQFVTCNRHIFSSGEQNHKLGRYVTFSIDQDETPQSALRRVKSYAASRGYNEVLVYDTYHQKRYKL